VYTTMSDIQPLREIKESSLRIEAKDIDIESVKAIHNTLGVLSSLTSSSSAGFSPSNFTLLPNPSPSEQPSKETLVFLRTLLLSTTDSALSNSSSSFLAGPSSESDEYGDVGLYLCPNSTSSLSKGSESQILDLLGLSSLLSKPDASIKPFKPTHNSNEYLHQLEDIHSFRVEGATDDGTVLFFLVGRYRSDWLGLVGIGVWS